MGGMVKKKNKGLMNFVIVQKNNKITQITKYLINTPEYSPTYTKPIFI